MSLDNQEENEDFYTSTLGLLWQWLSTMYDFERDAIKGEFLMRTKASQQQWQVIEDKHLAMLCVKATFLGYKGVEPKKIKMLLNSHLVDEKDFVVLYLNRVKKTRSAVGAIEKFLNCVTTNNQPLWLKYMQKWLVGCVANVVIKDGCQNHICPIMTGGQGAGKTTFIQNLIPAELTKYLFNGELDLNTKKDCYWKLVDYWILNIEEQIQALNRQDANTMKALITMPDIKGRKPYGMMDSRGYRIGNLIASTNEEGFLNDPTGSRRYPSFKILKINKEAYKKIDIDLVWAEAMQLFESKNYCYWVTPEDAEELKVNNKQFLDVSQEHELVEHYLQPVKNKKEATHVLQTTFLHQYLTVETGNKNLSSYRIGKALKALEFINDSHKGDADLYSTKKWFVKINRLTNNVTILDNHKNIN